MAADPDNNFVDPGAFKDERDLELHDPELSKALRDLYGPIMAPREVQAAHNRLMAHLLETASQEQDDTADDIDFD